jgi:hypothetical protein
LGNRPGHRLRGGADEHDLLRALHEQPVTDDLTSAVDHGEDTGRLHLRIHQPLEQSGSPVKKNKGSSPSGVATTKSAPCGRSTPLTVARTFSVCADSLDQRLDTGSGLGSGAFPSTRRLE